MPFKGPLAMPVLSRSLFLGPLAMLVLIRPHCNHHLVFGLNGVMDFVLSRFYFKPFGVKSINLFPTIYATMHSRMTLSIRLHIMSVRQLIGLYGVEE